MFLPLLGGIPLAPGLLGEITAESLTRTHKSVLRNPLIAEAFHRTGAVEVWGRGTNRVLEECRRYGVEQPTFEDDAGFVVVTFRVQIVPDAANEDKATAQVTAQVIELLKAARKPLARDELQKVVGLRHREHFRKAYLEPLIADGLLAMTMPDKPRSSKQRYRTTPAGEKLLEEKS